MSLRDLEAFYDRLMRIPMPESALSCIASWEDCPKIVWVAREEGHQPREGGGPALELRYFSKKGIPIMTLRDRPVQWTGPTSGKLYVKHQDGSTTSHDL